MGSGLLSGARRGLIVRRLSALTSNLAMRMAALGIPWRGGGGGSGTSKHMKYGCLLVPRSRSLTYLRRRSGARARQTAQHPYPKPWNRRTGRRRPNSKPGAGGAVRRPTLWVQSRELHEPLRCLQPRIM
eukprot:15485361-Alexandrium_andersonii.AAC.1